MNYLNQLCETISHLPSLAKEYPISIPMIEGFCISMLIWCIYLEVNPLIGGVFLRPDHKGNKVFRLQGIYPMLSYPFQTNHFWHPKNWDLNWIMFSSLGAAAWTFIRNMDIIRDMIFT